MKLSLKLLPQDQKSQSNNHPPPLLLRAKIPISAFSLPFLSSLSLSPSLSPAFSCRTNFSSGPSLKFSYTPTTATLSPNLSPNLSPFTVSLSSGVGLFGSPIDSPLTISANFALNPLNPNPNPNPTFSLLIKPRFGDFSIKKITSSPPNPNPDPNPNPNSEFGSFIPIERPGSWKDMTLNSTHEKAVISGASIWARTALPVTKGVAVRFRWGVNFPTDIRKNLPFLSVDKIEVERIDEVKEEREKKSASDFELLKGMCSSVGKELEDLRRENREMRRCLDEMKFGMLFKQNSGHRGGYSDGVPKKVMKPLQVSENLSEIEGWNKVKKNGVKDNVVKKVVTNNINKPNDLEGELQRAIKAASLAK